MNIFGKKITKFTIVVVISTILTVTNITPSFGQISLFNTPIEQQSQSSPPWNLNKAFSCGRFWCSHVYIYDVKDTLQGELLTPELTIAKLKELGQSNTEVSQIVEQRARLIQKIFDQIIKQVIAPPFHPEIVPSINDWEYWLPTSLKSTFDSDTTIKPIHPWTPPVEIGTKNKQTVIYVPELIDLGISSQSIVTVTRVDASVNGTNIENLAKNWQNNIRISFSNALWGYEFDKQYPFGRWIVIGVIWIFSLFLIWFIHLIRAFSRQRSNRLKFLLDKLTDSLTDNPEGASNTEPIILNNQDKIDNTNDNETKEQDKILFKNENINSTITDKTKTAQQNTSEKIPLKSSEDKFVQKKPVNLTAKLQKKERFLGKVFNHKGSISSRKSTSDPHFFLKKQNKLRQARNLVQLFLRCLFIVEILIFFCGLIISFLVFRQTRFLSVYLLRETLLIAIIWFLLIFIDKSLDFLIDYLLNRWASEGQIVDPNSNRYTLRAETYSSNLKKASTFFTVILGIYLAIMLLGVNPAFLTGAGFLAVGLAFLSRNLLEDLVNGALILSSDRYVIGDVIDLGDGMAGVVEDMNLFITSLRNLDGQLIAIPNSKITNVINNTKYWSQVNFTIKIGFYEDVEKAIAIMVEVANKMQNEEQWQDSFLEPIEVLGVDEISHQGILIRLLIKTAPSQHWALGREFRLRVKKAFESANISLGIPHHQISVRNTGTGENKLLGIFQQNEEGEPIT